MTQFKTIELSRDSYKSWRTPLRRYAPPAQLLSQMLQQHSSPDGAAAAAASAAYVQTAQSTVIRMPAGYRKTLVV